MQPHPSSIRISQWACLNVDKQIWWCGLNLAAIGIQNYTVTMSCCNTAASTRESQLDSLNEKISCANLQLKLSSFFWIFKLSRCCRSWLSLGWQRQYCVCFFAQPPSLFWGPLRILCLRNQTPLFSCLSICYCQTLNSMRTNVVENDTPPTTLTNSTELQQTTEETVISINNTNHSNSNT